jgi:hypothetical protein
MRMRCTNAIYECLRTEKTFALLSSASNDNRYTCPLVCLDSILLVLVYKHLRTFATQPFIERIQVYLLGG